MYRKCILQIGLILLPSHVIARTLIWVWRDFIWQYGADFSVKSPRVYAERLLKFIMGRTEGYDSERADGYIVSDTSASGRTFDETMPKETRPLPSARHSAIKCSHSVENLIQGKRNNAVSLERSRSLSFLPHVTTNIALRPLNRRKVRKRLSVWLVHAIVAALLPIPSYTYMSFRIFYLYMREFCLYYNLLFQLINTGIVTTHTH